MTLNIVLLEPQIPQNTGNISRTCAVTGARLHLIRPFGFEITDKQLKRAGLDYWPYLDVSYYENWEDFLAKNPQGEKYFFSTKARNRHSDIRYPDGCYLVFGREDAGLPESLLKRNPLTSVRIPMKGFLRSLNLSNSVAIGAYEVLRQWDYPSLSDKGELTQYRWDEEE